jgi:hypothetical protein
MEVHNFYRWQKRKMLAVAEVLSRRIPRIHLWDGFEMIYRCQLAAAAIDPICRPTGNLAVELMNDDHQVFALDFDDEIRRIALGRLPHARDPKTRSTE